MKHNQELEANIEKYENAKANGESIYLDVDSLMDIADYYFASDCDSKALEVVDYAIDLFPGATLPLCFRARQALNDKDIKLAQQYADRIEDRSDLEYVFLVAEIHICKREPDYADMVLEAQFETIDEDEKDEFAIDCAKTFFDYEEDEKCLKWLNSCHNHELIGYLETKSRWDIANGHFEDAEILLDKLIDIKPFSTEYWTQLASAQFLGNNMPKSIESCDYALAIDAKNAEAIMFKANALCSQENYEQATKYYKRYIDIVPESEIGYMFIGICYSNMDKHEDAIPYLLDAAKRCNPMSENLLPIYKELAFCHSALHHLQQALVIIDKAEQQPGSDIADTSCLRSICYMANDKMKEAVDYLEIATRYASTEHKRRILIDFSAAAIDCDRPDVAYQILHPLLHEETYAQNSDGWSFLALASFKLGMAKEFLLALKNACINNPNEAKQILGYLFPKELTVEDYINYAKNLLS